MNPDRIYYFKLELALIFALGCYGAALESMDNIHPLLLFIALHISSLGTMVLITISVKKTVSTYHLWIFVMLQIIAFRVAYFPVMVLAATVSSYSEWLMISLAVDLPIKIFAGFFISGCLFFTAISYLILQSVKGSRMPIIIVVVLGLPALMISFSSKEDLTFLPDHNWTDLQHHPKVKNPQQNPYWTSIQNNKMNPAKKLVALAGAVLYPIIPESPWAQMSKGMLEQAYRKNSCGTSHDRLNDHYAAFLVAFKKIYGR